MLGACASHGPAGSAGQMSQRTRCYDQRSLPPVEHSAACETGDGVGKSCRDRRRSDGLAVAYQALKDGHEVDVVEASQEPGGMAGHFDFGGISIERFYHFVCRADVPTVTLLRELGIAYKLRWKPTSMGFFSTGG
jgi:hypothetical protein